MTTGVCPGSLHTVCEFFRLCRHRTVVVHICLHFRWFDSRWCSGNVHHWPVENSGGKQFMLWSVCYLIFQSAHSFIPSFIDTHRHTALWTLLHIRVLLLLSLNIDFPVLPFLYNCIHKHRYDSETNLISVSLSWWKNISTPARTAVG